MRSRVSGPIWGSYNHLLFMLQYHTSTMACIIGLAALELQSQSPLMSPADVFKWSKQVPSSLLLEVSQHTSLTFFPPLGDSVFFLAATPHWCCCGLFWDASWHLCHWGIMCVGELYNAYTVCLHLWGLESLDSAAAAQCSVSLLIQYTAMLLTSLAMGLGCS